MDTLRAAAVWVRRFVQKFTDDRALSLASLLAWGMLNALLPLLLGILSLVGLLLGDSARVQAIEDQLLAILPQSVSALLRDSLAAFQHAAGIAGLISLGLLLFSGSNFFVNLESVFDIAYHVPERNIVRQRLVSFAALFVVTALLLVSTSAGLLASEFGHRIAELLPVLGGVVDATASSVVSVAALVCMMVLMYWLLPNTRHGFRHALPGAAVASILLLLVVRIFPIYIALFGQGFNLYAAFGTILLFMLWLYVVGVVLIGGAVLNAFLENPRRSVALASLAAQARKGQLEPPGA